MRNWTPEVRNKVKELLLDDKFNDIRFGSSAIYFQIYNDTGVKLFLNKQSRDFAFSFQKKGHESGIAPWISDRFELPLFVISHHPRDRDTLLDAYKRTIHGYLTQHTPTIEDTGVEFTVEQYVELMTKMEESGFCTQDLSERNMALVGNRLVCIDFDPLSQKKSY